MTPDQPGSRLEAARRACEDALRKGPLDPAAKCADPEEAGRVFGLLARATALRQPEPGLLDQFAAIPEPDRAQTVLLSASLCALTRIPTLPVSDTVKELFAEEFLFYANPPAAWRQRFQFSDVRYQEMARIATLQRFPAGQYHWELAAFPRSWLRKVDSLWRAATRAILPMGGFGPLFELHLNDRRKNRVMLLESETNLSCYRAASSLALNPRIKGIMTTSWLYCETTGAVTPHLAWMRRMFLDAGATIVNLGDAPRDSGFLIGSTERRRLYEEGSYRPKLSCVLWPRKTALRWAKEHPEFNR